MKTTAKAAFIAFVLAFGFAAPVSADEMDDAFAAYERGDYVTALRLWQPLAKQGNPVAQFSLALLYHEGKGVSQNYTEAVKWYRKAVEWGIPHAQANLGLIYADGKGVPQDYVEAYKWLDLAAANFHAEGIEQQNEAVRHRNLIAEKMTPAQIAEAQKLAREWRPKVKGSGN